VFSLAAGEQQRYAVLITKDSLMNRTQILHRALAFGNVALVFTGLALGGRSGITLNVILFLFVVLVLRIKFWLDDERYLEDVTTGKLPGGTPYYFGMCVAGISWLVWYLVGFFIKDIELSALLMAIVIGLSTVWIIAAMVSKGAYSEQVPWLFFNCFYILGFLLIEFRDRSWNPFNAHPDGFTTCVTLA
jgi:hypothetical protein